MSNYSPPGPPSASGGAEPVSIADGANVAQGATTDAESASGAGSLVALIKRLRTLLAGGLPAALGGHGGLVVEGVASGTTVPVDTELPAAVAFTTTVSNPTTPFVFATNYLYDGVGNTQSVLETDRSRTDSDNGSFAPMSLPWVWGGVVGWSRWRRATTFKTVTATASGDTALWTPASGKKTRPLFVVFMVTAEAASAGGADIAVTLRDATTDLGITGSFFAPAVSVTTGLGGYMLGAWDLGNGKLSAAANNVLNVNLSAALSAGQVRVFVCGTEE